MTAKQKILDKLAKLKSLGTSSNENEASMALAMMSKLIDKHNISDEMIDAMEQDKCEATEGKWYRPNNTGVKNWEIRLASAVAKLFSARIVIDGEYANNGRYKRNHLLFIGVDEDCEFAISMFEWIYSILIKAGHDRNTTAREELIEQLKDEFDEEWPDFFKWATLGFTQSYFTGAASRIESRVDMIIEKRNKQYEDNEPALMVINKKLKLSDDYVDDMDTNKTSTNLKYSDLMGLAEGNKKGDSINLDKQLDKAKNDLGQRLLR